MQPPLTARSPHTRLPLVHAGVPNASGNANNNRFVVGVLGCWAPAESWVEGTAYLPFFFLSVERRLQLAEQLVAQVIVLRALYLSWPTRFLSSMF